MAIVRYTSENCPKPTNEEWERVDRLKDEDIDFSDIPEQKDFSAFVPWERRHLLKERRRKKVAVALDRDVAAWLERDGASYQTQINAIFRQIMQIAHPA
ncbi:hypothetical protein FACS1894139_04140 [Planctomycetales bacterium]|nr:hypothetical protein FACS1894107_16510 [Planctomycetales bacterium]GHS97344.1 hypothetical protein FACS1894108_03570 [Planctomycetales bacterium]GHT03563.1 hypothetical protein FACS1894139_04140 [Planctomycetales bacterium]GHV19764.1 hypothetical protein AGMMS49959_05630 [Planctomycetales bacterium]